MTETDFAAIEAYLGRALPARYWEIMHDYPLNPDDLNSRIALQDDRHAVLAWNAELREGAFADEWNVSWFAIGTSPGGDTYFLDLSEASDTVFLWDHETHAVSEQAVDLDAFVAELRRGETASQATKTPPTTARKWWQFWR